MSMLERLCKNNYLIVIVLAFFASGIILSIDTLNKPSFSSAPLTSTSSATVKALEKYLFENFELKEDIPTSYIKQKWIYDCINENDYTNEISSQFKVFSKRRLKKRILKLIDL